MFGSIARLARPLVVLKLMNWKRVFICTPPPASTLSSTSPFCALLSRISVASPVAAALRATMPTELLGTTAICSSRGLSTCTPLLPPVRLRKGRLASGAIAPFTRRVSSTSTPWVPPVTVSTLACTRRSLSICCVAVMELLLVKAPVAAVEPTKNWAKSAVVALRVRSDGTVMSCSSLS